jgi:addiction module RelB/DinJ family antitoxin
MNTAVINIKTQPEVKLKAQAIARDLGLSLSSLINAYLKQFVKTKKVTFSLDDEIPNKRTIAIMKQAEIDYKKGNTSPGFKTGEEAVAWLEKQGI